jgi:hypothetical protein
MLHIGAADEIVAPVISYVQEAVTLFVSPGQSGAVNKNESLSPGVLDLISSWAHSLCAKGSDSLYQPWSEWCSG